MANNPECDWDGGDCCDSNSKWDKECCIGSIEELYSYVGFVPYESCTIDQNIEGCNCLAEDIIGL